MTDTSKQLGEHKHCCERIYYAMARGQDALAVKVLQDELAKARVEGAIEERERIAKIIDGTNCDMCGQENTMWNCLTDRMEVCNGAKHELLRNFKKD